MNSKRRFFSVCTALCLMLLLLAGCAAKPQPAGVGTDQPDPVQGLGLPEAGEWTVPLLTVYRLDGGEDNRVQMLYTGQWDLQRGCITTGELYETKHWAPLTPRSLPEEWQPQFIDQHDGSFTWTKDGETLRETPPEGGGIEFAAEPAALQEIPRCGAGRGLFASCACGNGRPHHLFFRKRWCRLAVPEKNRRGSRCPLPLLKPKSTPDTPAQLA